MRYLIIQNRETKGPYTLGQLRAMWNSGMVTGDTLFCEEGSENWQTLEVLAVELEQAPVHAPPLPAPPPVAAPLPVPQRQEPPPLLSGNNDLIYEDGVFTITTALIEVNGTTYALKNINSVKVVKKGLGCFSELIAIVLILGAIGLSTKGLLAAIFGVLFIAVVCCFIYYDRQRCVLAFDTSSGAVTGFESRDPAYLKKIAGKIGQAIGR